MSVRQCPDCKTDLTPIHVLDETGRNGQRDGLMYALASARRSIWTGQYPVQGMLHGFLCGECGRVLFYADRSWGGLPLAAEQPNPAANQLPRPADEQ
jgi:hypothetical protein